MPFGFETVRRPHRQLQLGQAHVQLALQLVIDLVADDAGFDRDPRPPISGPGSAYWMNGLRCLRMIFAPSTIASCGDDRAVRPDFHDQLVVVGPLADAGILDLVLDADDGREAAIDRDDADLAFLAGVLLGRAIAAAILDRHFDHEGHIVRQRGDDVIGIDDFDRLVGDDVGAP